ncbi:MAG TPA: hypothetical protein VI488_00965 [Candidatus Angelobacter sp.]
MRNFLQPRAEVDMVNASGVFRVTIDYKHPVVILLYEAMAIAGALFLGWERQWTWISSLWGPWVVAALIALNLVVLGYRLTATEVIEFSDRQLVVSRTNLGWQRTSEYSLEKCSKLEWNKPWGKPGTFRCKFGWRTISFGEYFSQEQADRLMAELQTALPNVAKHLLGGLEPLPRHFDTLQPK